MVSIYGLLVLCFLVLAFGVLVFLLDSLSWVPNKHDREAKKKNSTPKAKTKKQRTKKP
jgi:hypothetical protein